MGGASIGLAEGVASQLDNPAAFAHRGGRAQQDSVDWDVGLTRFDIVGSGVDIDMSGSHGGYEDASALQLGGNLKFGIFGFGLHISHLGYRLPVSSAGGQDTIYYAWSQQSYGLGLAILLDDGQWVLGVMPGFSHATMANRKTKTSVQMASSLDIGSVGVLWAPNARPYRIGLTLKRPVQMTQSGASSFAGSLVEDLGDLLVPRAVHVPWTVGVGGAYLLLGRRSLNQRSPLGRTLAVDHIEQVASTGRYLMATGDLVLTGPTDDGIGVQGWLAQRRQVSGASASLAVRVGLEAEVIEGWLVVRAGSYFEPSRFEGRLGRLHLTAGCAIKVPVVRDWSLSVAADGADGYKNLVVGIGLWR